MRLSTWSERQQAIAGQGKSKMFVSSSQVIIMISCLHFKLCVTKIIRLPDGGYMRVQVHINPDFTQAVASLVRRERDSVREELGGESNMKGSSFSELNRVLELRSL